MRKLIHANYSTDLDAVVHRAYDIALFAQLLEHEGIAAAELLAGSGIAESLLLDQEARVSFRQKLITFDNILRLSNNVAVGFQAGRLVHFSNLGILGYAVISSANFGEGLELGFKYLKLAGPVLRKTLTVDKYVLCFEAKDLLSLGHLLPLTVEFWFSSMHAFMSEMLGHPLPSQRIELPYPAPSYRKAYDDLFQCPIDFGAESIRWYIDAALLDQPMPNASSLTAQACALSCETLLNNLEQRDDLIHEIRSMLLSDPRHFSSIEIIAQRLHMSSRTLRRKLKTLGTTYQNILDDTREKLAIQYLQNTRMTIEEIADRTGFTEASNFSQAFKKWTGSSPSSLRKNPE